MNVRFVESGEMPETLTAIVDGLSDENLRQHLAIVAGLIAHRQSAESAATICCRVARELRMPTRGRA